MADFEPGQMVECVDANFRPKDLRCLPQRPIAGGHYTIRALSNGGRGVGLLLVELKKPLIRVHSTCDPARGVWQMEPPFYVSRFRLIRPTNIEPLRALLDVNAGELV